MRANRVAIRARPNRVVFRSQQVDAEDAEPILTPIFVLGSNLRIEYDPGRSATVGSGTLSALIDQIASHQVVAAAPANQPVYTLVDDDFGAAASFTTSVSGTDGVRSSAAHGTDLIASNSKVYVAWVARFAVGIGAPNECLLTLCGAASTLDLLFLRSGPSYDLALILNNAPSTLSTPVSVGVHLVELIYNGTTLELWLDDVLVDSQAATANVTQAIRRVAFGERMDDANWAGAKHAYMIACAAPPTTEERAQLLPFWRSKGAPV